MAVGMQSQRILRGAAEDSHPLNVSMERAELNGFRCLYGPQPYRLYRCFVTARPEGLHVVEPCRSASRGH